MNESKDSETRVLAELKRNSEAYAKGQGRPAAEFMKRYQELLGELYKARHPELTGEGHG